MKFLIDQDVYITTIRFIRELGHDVLPAAQIDLGTASDTELLTCAHDLERILITHDRDFGGLVFVGRFEAGVVYLRMLPSNQDVVHQELERVLNLYSGKGLRGAFVVVQPGQHRFRKIPEEISYQHYRKLFLPRKVLLRRSEFQLN